jgi:hypothetical protein
MPTRRDQVSAWADSGAMALTGHADGPGLGPPDGLVSKLDAIASPLGVDPLQLLVERAALTGLTRNGTTSCGGATRLLPTHEGWIALSLARPDDLDLMEAWLGIDADADEPWAAIGTAVADRATAVLLAAAEGLGLPLTALPPEQAPDRSTDLPVGWTAIHGDPGADRPLDGLQVVDLGSLWAGPLCGALLAGCGASVTKIESSARPDGARSGSAEHFARLNGSKAQVSIDFTSEAGRAELRDRLAAADVVIEASRPRALRALGIAAEELLATASPRAWVSITGHGRSGTSAERVAFGDDAAVAGGLVARDAAGDPVFCADAIADPATGLVAAAAVLEALGRGGRWLIDASMADISRYLAGPTIPVPDGLG